MTPIAVVSMYRGKYLGCEFLAYLRRRAIRRHVWFNTLRLDERTLMDLVIKQVKIVRNVTLATVLARIISKILFVLRSPFLDKADKIGRKLAQKVSEQFCSLGNKEARNWAEDPCIIRYLGTMALNNNSVPHRFHKRRQVFK